MKRSVEVENRRIGGTGLVVGQGGGVGQGEGVVVGQGEGQGEGEGQGQGVGGHPLPHKEKEKSPHTPLKETEISPAPDPVPVHHACARAQEDSSPFGSGSGSVDIFGSVSRSGSGSGSGTGAARRVKVDRDFILYGEFDPVNIALQVLGIPKFSESASGRRYNNARLMRWVIRIIGEEWFRELIYRQWCENRCDGAPKNAAAAFQAKLYAAKDKAQSAAATEGGAR